VCHAVEYFVLSIQFTSQLTIRSATNWWAFFEQVSESRFQ
jgi:hypothetical protein